VLRVNLPVAWLRLYARFRITASDLPEPMHLSSMVVPVTNMDDLLRKGLAAQTNIDLSGTAGAFVALYTVGPSKRAFMTWAIGSGTTVASRLAVIVNGKSIFLSALATAESTWGPGRICMEPGDEFGMLATGDAGDSSRWCRVTYEEEDAYPTPEGPGVET